MQAAIHSKNRQRIYHSRGALMIIISYLEIRDTIRMQLVGRKFYLEVVPEYMSHHDFVPKINVYCLLLQNDIDLFVRKHIEQDGQVFNRIKNIQVPFFCNEWPAKEDYSGAIEGQW